MAGWFSIAVGVAVLALAAFAWLRRWSPQRWGGLHKHFAAGTGGLGTAMIGYGITQLTDGGARIAGQALAIAGFLVAVGTLLRAYRDAAAQNDER